MGKGIKVQRKSYMKLIIYNKNKYFHHALQTHKQQIFYS